MEETKQEERMNKKLFILGGIILLAVIAIFAFNLGGVDETPATDNTGSGIDVSDTGDADIVQKPEAKTETKKPLLPKAVRGLTPEETVEAFWTAVYQKQYDNAMEYVSPQAKWPSSKWDLVETTEPILEAYNLNKIEITEVQYLDEAQTMAIVKYEMYFISKDKEGSTVSHHYKTKFQKEDSVWKIIS